MYGYIAGVESQVKLSLLFYLPYKVPSSGEPSYSQNKLPHVAQVIIYIGGW
jgi:hypothetical protein